MLIYFGLFVLSLILTYLIREYALKKSILDLPNERSSHTVPTPRGGGLAIIVSFFVGIFLLKQQIPENLFFALLAAIPLIIVNIIDDMKSISFQVRLFIQALSIILALYVLGGVHSFQFLIFEFTGVWLNGFAFIVILWLTNLYNFLDGINGYVGGQTVMIGLGLVLLFSNSFGYLLIASVLGFLYFNWGKATIFMGDVGSATLGFIIGVLIFSDTSYEMTLFWFTILLVFLFDATLTLVRRFMNREKLTQAHKKHAYQRLVQSGYSHQSVSLFLILLNGMTLLLLYFVNDIMALLLCSIMVTTAYLWVEKQKGFHDG